MNGKVTYRQQYTRCGKQRCRKCQEGAGHGPYWYGYWSENGRTVSKYIGIKPPAEIEALPSPLPQNPDKRGVPPSSVNDALTPPEKTEIRETPEVSLENDNPTPHLRIYLLGQFRVDRWEGDKWITVANRTWQRRRARALLGCLLSQTGRRMGREQMMEALWPDLEIETTANRLNGAVHELRQILEPEIARPAASKLLRLERDILILADTSHIWVDAEAFETYLNKANATRDQAQVEQLLEQAVELYEGDYLIEELYSEWAAARRESLRRGWMGLLLELAELRAARGALTSAIEPLDRLLTTDPSHETAIRRLMVLLTQLDRRGEAIRAYQRLANILQRDYESEPLPETMNLYKSLRQGLLQVSQPATGALANANPTLQTPQWTPAHREDTPHQPSWSAPSGEPTPLPSRPALQLGRHNQSPLIGRERELESMRQQSIAIENISQDPVNTEQKRNGLNERYVGLAHLVVLMGETGIGKTRLAEDLSQEVHLRGWQVAWTRAYEQEGTIPYRPWTDILRTLLRNIPLQQVISMIETNKGRNVHDVPGALNSATTAQARLARLSSLLPELTTDPALALELHRLQAPISPEQERLHLWEAMLTLLSTLTQSAPLLLVLDDLHWTDDSSLELLAYLARHQQNERIMLLGTCRDIELSPNSSLRVLINDLRREQVLTTLPLQPLTHSQISALLAHLPRELVKSIQSQAGGNPLFAEELARVSEKSTQKPPSTQADISSRLASPNRATSLPETIAAVLERRLSNLSNECQALLSKAAVLGGSFEFRLLLHTTGESESHEDILLDLLEEALHSGLLNEEVSGGRIVYHFWHPLIVSHLYERISAARRAQMHRRTALALIELHTGNEAEVAAAIAHHLKKSGHENQKLAHYAEMAGNQAFLLAAYPEALHYYRQTLEALQSLHPGSHGEQDPMHIANLLECIAECNTFLGNFSEAREQYTQVLRLHNAQHITSDRFASPADFRNWQQEEAQVQGLIWRAIGYTWKSVGEFREPHECTERGKEVLQSAGLTGGIAWACLEHLDGGVYWAEGNFSAARSHVQTALEIHETYMHQLHEQNEKNHDYQGHRHTLLMTRSRRALLGDPLERGRAQESLGVINASMGQYSEAQKYLYTALAIYEEHDLVGAMSQVCSNIGAIHAMRGEYEVAGTYLKRSLELTERTGDIPSKVLVSGNLGDVATRKGDLPEAESWLINSAMLAERISDREHSSWCLAALASVQQDLGDMRGSLEKIRRALVAGRQIKSTARVGFALITLADWRISLALILSRWEPTNDLTRYTHLLHTAASAAERALTLEEIDAETQYTGQLVLANIHLLLGNLEKGRQLVLKTLEETRKNETMYLIGRSQRLLGEFENASGREQEADICFEEALRISQQCGLRLEYARTLQSYGTSLLQRRSLVANVRERQRDLPIDDILYKKGLDYLHEACSLFKKCKATTDLNWVEYLLAEKL